MVVQHNLTAMNSNRMLGITTGTQAKSTEKLSSGYKINRAADDAAGLSISEKMRKQIRGLTQASLNAEDGISAVQTAEGALNEVQDMLQRMNELAVKSANGTMSENDREYIQNEIDQLVTEIDRVAETTKFNETYLLKGNAHEGTAVGTEEVDLTTNAGAAAINDIKFAPNKDVTDGEKLLVGKVEITTVGATAFAKGAPAAGTSGAAAVTLPATDANIAKLANIARDTTTDGRTDGTGTDYSLTFKVVGDGAAQGNNVASNIVFNGTSYASAADLLDKTGITLDVTQLTAAPTTGSDYGVKITATKSADTYGIDTSDASSKLDLGAMAVQTAMQTATVAGGEYEFNVGDEVYVQAKVTDAGTASLAAYDKTYVPDPLKLKLHVGADSTDNNKIGIDIESMGAANLGVAELKVDGKDSTNADAAINTITAAIQKVSTQRSALGAVQNRLEHTIANLDNVVENTTAAESQIRDTDMATEMVKYSNNNILAQAGQAMLAQANQANQGVLSLLG